MKKRVIYSVLFGIPGFIISGIISIAVCGFAAGVLWIFVFGDNLWPSFIDKLFPVLFALTFLPLWFTFITGGFFIGKKLEHNPILNKKHILIAVSATIIPVLLIVIQQFIVGNIGSKSTEQLCSDYCSRNGYSAISMPPRNSGENTCSCLDDFGVEVLKVPLQSIDPRR